MQTNEGIEVFIEGGTPAEQRVLTMVVNDALTKSGFKDTHQFDHQGTERPFSATAHRLMYPTVMDYMRSHSPDLFQTPVIVSAYAPPPRKHERRHLDRTMLQALQVATSYADTDPDEIWNGLDDEQKEQMVRMASNRRVAYS